MEISDFIEQLQVKEGIYSYTSYLAQGISSKYYIIHKSQSICRVLMVNSSGMLSEYILSLYGPDRINPQ